MTFNSCLVLLFGCVGLFCVTLDIQLAAHMPHFENLIFPRIYAVGGGKSKPPTHNVIGSGKEKPSGNEATGDGKEGPPGGVESEAGYQYMSDAKKPGDVQALSLLVVVIIALVVWQRIKK